MTTNLFHTDKTADISPCGHYRYRLTRTWDEDKPGVLWVLLNPSVADSEQDDPTIRRCMGFARAWDCGMITVVNLFAFRATDPGELISHAPIAVGPRNNQTIRRCVAAHSDPGDLIIAAWGANASRPALQARRNRVIELLPLADLMCLDVTQSGEPKHPLYCRADLTPCRYEVTR